MELQQMRYAIAVAEERNFTRAAERCHVVQSALSHQIKALERELGVDLFARTSRRVAVTSAGEAFLAAARTTLEAADRAVAEASAAAGQIRGSLTIGLIPTVTVLDVPAALGAFHPQHPEVRIKVEVGGSGDFIAAIAEGAMDVAVIGLPELVSHPGVETLVLARERHVVLVSSDHRLAGRRRLKLAELADETFVDFPASSPGREQTDRAFREHGIRREVAFEVMNANLIEGLVANGLAIALLTPGAISDRAGLQTIAVTDGPTRVECLAWSGFNPTPAAQAFLDQVRPAAQS